MTTRWRRRRMSITQAWLTAALALTLASQADSARSQPTASAGGGNYCSLIDRLLWTSNRASPAPTGINPVETFNLFIMDGRGGRRAQMTNDRWPIINHHPVFTPDCRRIVWVRGTPGHMSLWIMNLNGSGKRQIAAPPADAEDAHPWIGTDGNIYFARHNHNARTHRLWRMGLNGAGPTEIVGSDDVDRFHPNLHRDRNLVLYSIGDLTSGKGTEIRVFNQQTKEDKVLYAPGWSVSAAIWHPTGDRVVLAEDNERNGRYRIVEVAYPGGTLIRALTDNSKDNTIPYYAYPSAAAIDWVQWSGSRTTRNIARMNADGSGKTPLTNDAYENTKIIGEIEIVPDPAARRGHRCVPRPVGCYPTPPPCEKVLLPSTVAANAERLAQASAKADRDQGRGQSVSAENYLAFARSDIAAYIERTRPAPGALRQAALTLQKFLSGETDNDARERLADIYVNSYVAALGRSNE